MSTVGWIGLGAMGAPMACCVAQAGHTVTAYDIDPQKAIGLGADGVKPADTIAAAAADADVLVPMVATAGQAESVLYGEGKAAAALKPGAVATAYPTPLASAAEQLFLAGRRAGLGRADDSSLIQVLRGETTAR